jgi:hypothetical protein
MHQSPHRHRGAHAFSGARALLRLRAQMRPDCLRIIARAEMRMANEIDAARDRGEIAKGRPSESVQTSDTLGLDRRHVSGWREVPGSIWPGLFVLAATLAVSRYGPERSAVLGVGRRVDARRAATGMKSPSLGRELGLSQVCAVVIRLFRQRTFANSRQPYEKAPARGGRG